MARSVWPVVLLASTVLPCAEAQNLVSCNATPDCEARSREPCSHTGEIANACGNCKLGNYGALGPTNSYCLSNRSCAAIYPGLDACEVPGVGGLYEGSQLPLVIPFGACVCDEGDGLRWPTAPGKCATLRVMNPEGSGLYALDRCTSRTCEPETCSLLTTWAPTEGETGGGFYNFECRNLGTDSTILKNDCWDVVGRTPSSAFCGHPGLIDNALDSVQEWMLRCEVAPKCPASVLADNLEETCCMGNDKSFGTAVGQFGNEGEQALGFCARQLPTGELVGKPVLIEVISASGFRNADTRIQGNSDPYCIGKVIGREETAKFRTQVVDDTQDPVFEYEWVLVDPQAGDSFEFSCWDRDYGSPHELLGRAILRSVDWQLGGYNGELQLQETGGPDAFLKLRVDLESKSTSDDCAVRTDAPGWTGCACMDRNGLPKEDRVCTVDCTRDECSAANGGIPPTPERWKTSDIPEPFERPARSERVAAVGAARTMVGSALVPWTVAICAVALHVVL